MAGRQILSPAGTLGPVPMPRLACEWLRRRRKKPRLFVDLFASNGEVGLEVALDEDLVADTPLAGRVVMIGDDEAVDEWSALLGRGSASKTLEGLRRGNRQRAYRLATVGGHRMPSSADFRAASLAGVSESARTPAEGSPAEDPASVRENLIDAIAALGSNGRLEYRGRDGLEALANPELARDPDAAFFAVPPRAAGHHDALRLLRNVAGDFVAAVEDSARARVRARQLGLSLRRLGNGEIADHAHGPVLLVGKDLRWADEDGGR